MLCEKSRRVGLANFEIFYLSGFCNGQVDHDTSGINGRFHELPEGMQTALFSAVPRAIINLTGRETGRNQHKQHCSCRYRTHVVRFRVHG